MAAVNTCMLIGAVFFCVMSSGATSSGSLSNEIDCPNDGYDRHGDWYLDDKGGPRCILHCDHGYKPSRCNVLRSKRGGWNKPVPVCEKEPFVSGKTVLAVGTEIVAGVVAAPAVLAAAGFTTAGVAVGSLAAFLQTPFTVAGSWFAASQSAGVLGIAATTKAGIGAATGGATYVASSLFSDCEAE